MAKFEKLKPGDRLRVIAPSGRIRELKSVETGLDIWREQAYQISLTSGYDRSWGYLAGTDSDRRRQLLDAIGDDYSRGILCARGGYGATRLLEGLSIADIPPSTNPKFLIGFSDITALLWALSGQENILAIHGPVLTTLAQEPDWAIARLFDYLAGKPLQPLHGDGWGGGKVRGRLFPGNLTVATYLLGTPHQPDLTNAILAFEDVNEEPYRLDRMLTYWRTIGAFQPVLGIALGRFSQSGSDLNSPADFSVEQVLRDRLFDLNIPIVANLSFGHDGPNPILPVGLEVELDGDRGVLSWPTNPPSY
ncbi:MAG: LD-carboxypeptidase [Limnospira sp. PMC 1291.21]|uniref:S66 peptidase family protein n=1 Tax=Limnospira TaxID=2596745 RepID=UPI0002803F9F|nr:MULTISPECIES: LD-carboxypeptidase [Limnospira]EKD09564.1 peptidase U61 LD-carboxypeptidase A [Arthrospira platensis C1]MDT9176729.1 LD-carboxypeptidase [Limnospira sp. PMC 1238.20]MDT9222796.1 LD-carboxypeptidase [Limnospira sp. PMC 1279.21]MDT9227795.1 LD-carboxypeptidase [Limnospira sp. PMC 1242.20]MDT9238099.1 LD-carboxypeptidase [Limnospira sp. PMC 1261.20]